MSDVTGWISTPSQPRCDRAALHQVLDDLLGGRGRNVEGDADTAARRREDRGVDADDLAVEVEGRAARIAAVDRGVDLEEVVIGAGADVAAARRDDAGGDGAAEAERIADGHHPVADADLGIVGEVDIGELAAAIDLEHREVGARVGADQLGVEFLAVIGHHGEGGAFLDDVVVGDEIAVLGDEEAGALRHRPRLVVVAVAVTEAAMAVIVLAVLVAKAAEFLEEAAQLRIVGKIVEAVLISRSHHRPSAGSWP